MIAFKYDFKYPLGAPISTREGCCGRPQLYKHIIWTPVIRNWRRWWNEAKHAEILVVLFLCYALL